jgi:hypothetical protein
MKGARVDAIDLGKLIEQASSELGPNASDEEITAKVLDFIESLNESDKAAVLDQLAKVASTAQLTHLRGSVEGRKGREIS